MVSSNAPVGILILAAGQGKRMHSPLPKVLHQMGGRSLLSHVLTAVKTVTPLASVGIVVGHGKEKVEAAIRQDANFAEMNITFIHQAEQKGTGHATQCAMMSEWGESLFRAKGNVLVLPGDLPLITPQMVEQMTQPLGRGEVLRLLTCELTDPTGYGRIVRRGKRGSVLRIVEEKDAVPREKLIREVGLSIYLFQASYLRFGLERMKCKNAQGEYYLTDLIGLGASSRKKMDVLSWLREEDLRGVNDPWELGQAAKILNERCLKSWAKRGVIFLDPTTTWVDCGVELAENIVIHPGAILSGNTKVGAGTEIGPYCVLKNAEVGENTEIKVGTVINDSRIGSRCHLGPYAHFRPESSVEDEVKIGNFVELKKSKVGFHTSVAHLSYLGDAEIGKNVNIGCGFVTCNFDGRVIDGSRKHKTVIEDDVFLGSDCQCVAPVRIGRGSYVASGSTITEDVEPESLAIARTRQVNKPGYARKLRG